MTDKDKNAIAVDKIRMAIDELDGEQHREQAAIIEGRIKGFLELSFATKINSPEENEKLWKEFAAVREKIFERF